MDRAYKIAVEWDEPCEKLKDELIDLVQEFGSVQTDKSKLLDGSSYEISIDGVPPLLVVQSKRKR